MDKDIDIIALWDKGKQMKNLPDLDIDKTIQSKSKGTLYWIKLILYCEFYINLATLPLSFKYFFIDTLDYFWGSIIILITTTYLFYYLFLIRKIKAFSFATNVKTSLKKLYRYLNFFLLHYKVVIWLSLAVGLLKVFLEDVPKQATPEQMEQPMYWVATISFSILFVGAIGALIHFLVHLIYGRKINRLKKMVKDFE